MPSNASVKGNFVYVFNEQLKVYLEQQGFKPLHITSVNKTPVWVYEKNDKLFGYLQFNKNSHEQFVMSDKLNFVV